MKGGPSNIKFMLFEASADGRDKGALNHEDKHSFPGATP